MSAPAKYRKKPVVIEAMQYDGSIDSVKQAVNFIGELKLDREAILIDTLEGTMHASPGDWIIKGVNGEFYPCKPDIFAKTYAREDTAWPEAEA